MSQVVKIVAAAACMMAAFAAVAIGADDALEAGISRVKAVSDGICSVTSAAVVSKDGAMVKDPLVEWAAMQTDDAKAHGVFLRVDFVLVPEAGSDIRCRAELPLPGKWDGRLWGQGNSGYAGALPRISSYVAEGTAAVTTDLGTRGITDGGKSNSRVWPANVRRDSNWRATHLMTVYGKKIVEAFYGRPCHKVYFFGGSTGGRQAMSEALRFPDDYDGIIAGLPDNNAAVSEIAVWHLWRQTHDADGCALFTTNDMRVVADAAVEYRAGKDPAPYSGNFLADARFSEADIDGFLALAAGRAPQLAVGDRLQRLKALYMPLVHGGVCYFNGYAPGSYLGRNMSWMGIINLRSYLMERGIKGIVARWKDVGWKEIDGYLREYAPEFNACSPDLSAFAARGGKLVMVAGWEDQTIPPAPIVDYYERVCRKDGGLERTKEYFRLFCASGCAHGGGIGRAMTGVPGGATLRKQLVAWRENGVPPKSIPATGPGRTCMPVAAYPGLFVKDASGKWMERTVSRGVANIDGRCLATECEVGGRKR